MRQPVLSFLLPLLAAAPSAFAADFSGDYTHQTIAGDVALELRMSENGEVKGRMSDGFDDFRLAGKASGNAATGLVRGERPPDLGFSAELSEDGRQLRLQIYPRGADGQAVLSMAQTMIFSRDGQPAAAGPADDRSDARVFINGQALSDSEVSGFEQQYQTQLVDGRYWYDARCGAWGLEGGPTIGFILPGLALPGPMPDNISGGGTGIWINGRELHPLDRQALINMFGTALPGRYWLDAHGNLGAEGGPVIVNLAAAAQRLQQQTTSSRYGTVSTGPSGAMFSGTSLSTGKPTFWYAGM